jgi:hypothetical protein
MEKLKPGKTNKEDRMWFVEYWANFVRNNPDKVWSEQQRVLIDSQIQGARSIKLTPQQYLKIKGEKCLRK